MSLNRQPFWNVQNLSRTQKLCKNQDYGDSFFIFSFFPSLGFLSFLFFSFSLIARLILRLKKDSSFFTFSAQMASIEAARSLINIGEFSCGEVFVITFSFLTRLWLRKFAKNNRYHSAIVPNIPISLMVNIFC